jgi:hypothetical protein
MQFTQRQRVYLLGQRVLLEAPDLLEICNFIVLAAAEVIKKIRVYGDTLGIPNSGLGGE